MKKYIVSIMIIVTLLAGCTGQAAQPPDINAGLGQEFTLLPGQRASITGELLQIRFIEVVTDSRCPAGVQCIWAGDVSCRIEFTYRNSPVQRILTQPGSGAAYTYFNEYQITFNVQPYPQASQTSNKISREDYRLKLTVAKPVLSGGILATFRIINETFKVFITNPQTIDRVFAVQRGDSNAKIPNGRIVRGAVFYNQPWNWHIDPVEISMAELTIELCDGKPSMVEADIDYWVNTVRYFCPWSAELIKVDDFR